MPKRPIKVIATLTEKVLNDPLHRPRKVNGRMWHEGELRERYAIDYCHNPRIIILRHWETEIAMVNLDADHPSLRLVYGQSNSDRDAIDSFLELVAPVLASRYELHNRVRGFEAIDRQTSKLVPLGTTLTARH